MQELYNSDLDKQNGENIKNRCKDFLIEAFSQLEKRISNKLEIIQRTT